MTPFRRRLWLSGLIGLAADGLLAALAAWLVSAQVIRPPLPYPLVIVGLTVVLGVFSLAEVPMMVIAIRHLAAERTARPRFVMILNAIFVFFAAVYGVPVVLVTGGLVWGLVLCALGLVRLAASLIFVRAAPAAGGPGG